MYVSHTAWIALIAAIAIMLIVDLTAKRKQTEISMKSAAIWSAVWVACGLAVGGVIWFYSGSEFALQYYSGYLIEKSLAIDNVFVWGLLFSAFAIPIKYQHRVLFLGVIGALIMRAILIFAGAAIIKEAAWVLYIFGAFLIATGFKMFKQRNEHFSLDDSRFYRWLSKKIKVTDTLHGEKFRVIENGKKVFTPLFLALILVEFMDLVFAVDSIPAIFSVTEIPFLVFASNAMAILGLRSMYFLLTGLMDKFIYLKEGLSVILVWVGIKMIVSHAIVKIPSSLSLAVIASIITATIVISLKAKDSTQA
jgi:tellurite resistance protein TerC